MRVHVASPCTTPLLRAAEPSVRARVEHLGEVFGDRGGRVRETSKRILPDPRREPAVVARREQLVLTGKRNRRNARTPSSERDVHRPVGSTFAHSRVPSSGSMIQTVRE